MASNDSREVPRSYEPCARCRHPYHVHIRGGVEHRPGGACNVFNCVCCRFVRAPTVETPPPGWDDVREKLYRNALRDLAESRAVLAALRGLVNSGRADNAIADNDAARAWLADLRILLSREGT